MLVLPAMRVGKRCQQAPSDQCRARAQKGVLPGKGSAASPSKKLPKKVKWSGCLAR